MSIQPGRISQVAFVVLGFLAIVLVVVNLYSGYRKLQQAAAAKQTSVPGLENLERPAPDFSMTDQSGRTVRLENLRGKVWAASFIFTHCHGPCPLITKHMAALQAETADLPDVRLVSMTLDPDRDTSEVMNRFASGFQADPERWYFLTGPRGDLERVVQKGFLTAMQPVEGTDQIIHGTMVALVDRRGMIRGFLSGTDPELPGKASSRLRELHLEKIP
jgi:protein SCO1/2